MLLGARGRVPACRAASRAAARDARRDRHEARPRACATARCPRVTAWRQARVVVVGGGVAGLGAAWELRRRGVKDVLVLELDDVVGGTARGGAVGGHAVSVGRALRRRAAERGRATSRSCSARWARSRAHAADGTPIVDEALRCREPEERVWYLRPLVGGPLPRGAARAPTTARSSRAFNGEIDRWSGWRDAQGRAASRSRARAAATTPRSTRARPHLVRAWLDAAQADLAAPALARATTPAATTTR